MKNNVSGIIIPDEIITRLQGRKRKKKRALRSPLKLSSN